MISNISFYGSTVRPKFFAKIGDHLLSLLAVGDGFEKKYITAAPSRVDLKPNARCTPAIYGDVGMSIVAGTTPGSTARRWHDLVRRSAQRHRHRYRQTAAQHP
jgi:hypothetical protein